MWSGVIFQVRLRRWVKPSPLVDLGTTLPLAKTPRSVQGEPGTAGGSRVPVMLLRKVAPVVVKHWMTPVRELPAPLNGWAVKPAPGFRPKPKKPISELSYL